MSLTYDPILVIWFNSVPELSGKSRHLTRPIEWPPWCLPHMSESDCVTVRSQPTQADGHI